jgi:hypothetical protein
MKSKFKIKIKNNISQSKLALQIYDPNYEARYHHRNNKKKMLNL